MISWMQRHNKYLVWTIWVATVAFIGAGFVGWGSYNFGSKAGNVAKVGEIEIPQSKLNMVYSDMYNEYNQKMQGQLDEAKAKELGLVQQAFAAIETQTKVLNFAKENGIIVSDEEIAKVLQSIKLFQKNGQFSKENYDHYLKNRRMTAKTFEEALREELTISKTLNLLTTNAMPFEEKVVSSAINIADKIAYKVLTLNDIKVDINDSDIQTYWELQKDNFMTPKQYKLSIVWTDTTDTAVTDDELQKHFAENSFNYTDQEGKQLSFEEAKENVTNDLKLQKSKKAAQKAYIAFKKGELSSNETLTLPVNDMKLSAEIWDEIAQKSVGEIMKPKVANDRYATIKIEEVIEPRVKSYEEAKEETTAMYKVAMQQKGLSELAENTLQNFDDINATTSNFLTLNKNVNLAPLNSEESLQFIQKLFTSPEEKGMISVVDKVVIYNILEQKVMPTDENQSASIKQRVGQLKKGIFENNFLQTLDKKYPVEVYVQGLTN
ncbi:SurA N-terminal domain-containing protein [Sulfurovum sp. zt1-1]|uniref:SurA N-terminal domain-containing protein n=1 Tax=Sulfurovum zhangzhouensis TaxID=3019067 RepID=A0ABT7QYW2_9BACT|nr:peptidylprolyl isomerase [Sulfurovum zhangzhouensis]MDM5272020.1 SurA N-terminal domain-containing protein [Sulfurovum zhangzhouensis]